MATQKPSVVKVNSSQNPSSQSKPHGLELIVERTEWERNGYRTMSRVAFIACVVAAMAIGIAFYSLKTKPPVKFIALDPSGRMIPLTPLNSPVMSRAALLNWAGRMSTLPYNVDFLHYRDQLSRASLHFTTAGWASFQAAYKPVLDAITTSRAVVSGTLTGAPIFMGARIISGVMEFRVQAPISVTFVAGKSNTTQSLVVTMTIDRRAETVHPDGLAITEFHVEQRRLSQ